MALSSKQTKNNQRLAARFTKLNAGRKMSLEEFQSEFKDFCKSVMRSNKNKNAR